MFKVMLEVDFSIKYTTSYYKTKWNVFKQILFSSKLPPKLASK